MIKLTKKREEIMQIMQFNNLFNVLRYYPYRYDILKETIKPTMEDHNKKITIEGFIMSDIKVNYISKSRQKTMFNVTNNFLSINVVMFNRFWYKSLKRGSHVIVYGKYDAFKNEITASTFMVGELNNQERIITHYSLSQTIKDSTYKNFVLFAYNNEKNNIIDAIPSDFIQKYKLGSLKEALYSIHFPESEDNLHQAKRYLKYEEFLNFCVLSSLKRKMYSLKDGIKQKHVNFDYVKSFIHTLPFSLTIDQKEACKEILHDIDSTSCMSRLLQGDVGSGKTIVALIALVANYKAGFQGAIMAPTDILAKQHFKTIVNFLNAFDTNIKVILLVGGMSTKDKKQTLEDIQNGKANIIVGTHALISSNVNYYNLGLAVIDEQHRFGVKQRITLKEKGKKIDVLYMSATPIPRTLASTIYMDMDVSTIQAYPYKERIIHTEFINSLKITTIKKDIDNYLAKGKKIYIVCPCIDESQLELNNVIKTYQSYKKGFPNIKIGLLHGKLANDEKEKVMQEFESENLQILISTTVIEVGINVIDANMIIIYNAERFGLAQIHQLRGRIARDGQEGYCYLLSASTDEEVIDRLKFICTTNDGFKISEYDLKRRGAGDMLGIAQSGKSPFTIANLIDDFKILKVASEDATKIVNDTVKYKDYLRYINSILEQNENYLD